MAKNSSFYPYAERYAVNRGMPEKGRPRDEILAELREISGTTVLVYDQTCAAEKRRRRKRGTFPDPPRRLFINEAVCEGCGDCSLQSNCLAVVPVETALGRKRAIDQSACNKDYSCLKGFCPSFVTVHGGRPRRGTALAEGAGSAQETLLPEPALPALERPYGIVVTGVGGTGELFCRGLGRETDDSEVRLMGDQDRSRSVADRGGEIREVGAVGAADLNQFRTRRCHHIGQAERAADLDQLPSGDDHLVVGGVGPEQ